MLSPGQFVPLCTYEKVAPFPISPPHRMLMCNSTQPPPMGDIDPTSGLSLPSYASHGVNVAFVFNNLSAPVAIHAMDCLTIHFFIPFSFPLLLTLASAHYVTYCPHCPLWDMYYASILHSDKPHSAHTMCFICCFIAHELESYGVCTFSAKEMAFNILGLMHSPIQTQVVPIWADLKIVDTSWSWLTGEILLWQ